MVISYSSASGQGGQCGAVPRPPQESGTKTIPTGTIERSIYCKELGISVPREIMAYSLFSLPSIKYLNGTLRLRQHTGLVIARSIFMQRKRASARQDVLKLWVIQKQKNEVAKKRCKPTQALCLRVVGTMSAAHRGKTDTEQHRPRGHANNVDGNSHGLVISVKVVGFSRSHRKERRQGCFRVKRAPLTCRVLRCFTTIRKKKDEKKGISNGL